MSPQEHAVVQNVYPAEGMTPDEVARITRERVAAWHEQNREPYWSPVRLSVTSGTLLAVGTLWIQPSLALLSVLLLVLLLGFVATVLLPVRLETLAGVATGAVAVAALVSVVVRSALAIWGW